MIKNIHDLVKKALAKDGWTITHDPYRLRYGIADVYIDLAGEKERRKIAVKVKSFIGASIISEFHTVLNRIGSRFAN